MGRTYAFESLQCLNTFKALQCIILSSVRKDDLHTEGEKETESLFSVTR